MSEVNPRTVEMAKREILERMCSVSNPPTAYDVYNLAQAYKTLVSAQIVERGMEDE